MRLTISGSRQLTITNIRDDENIKKQKKHQDDIYNKLSQLEDIEEKLGIDLLTLFKVLKNGTYVYYKKGKKIERGVINHFLNIPNAWYITICGNDKFYSTKKYGKTWSLVKEDLL